jgi:hypothetical protein
MKTATRLAELLPPVFMETTEWGGAAASAEVKEIQFMYNYTLPI